MTESAEQIAERIIAANSDWPASAFPKTVDDIAAALTAAHQERDAAIRRADEATTQVAVLREALNLAYPYIQMAIASKAAREALDATPAASIAALEKRVMLECAAIPAAIPDRYPNRRDDYCRGAAETAEYIAAAIRKLAEGK